MKNVLTTILVLVCVSGCVPGNKADTEVISLSDLPQMVRIETTDPTLFILEYKDLLVFERDADGTVRIDGKVREVCGMGVLSDEWHDAPLGARLFSEQSIRKIQIWTK